MRSTCLALATLLLCSCTPDLRNVNWSTYLGDPGRSHYSELVQINRDNVHELDVAWVYDSGELVPGSRPIMYTSPLVIDGVLYHGIDREGTDAGPGLADIGARLTRGQLARVLRDARGRMPSFDHLQDFERNAVLAHVRSPVSEVKDPPGTEVDYVFGGSLRVRDHEGLPGNSPPWGTLTSIDLATGGIDWQVPFGDYPETEGLGLGAEN